MCRLVTTVVEFQLAIRMVILSVRCVTHAESRTQQRCAEQARGVRIDG